MWALLWVNMAEIADDFARITKVLVQGLERSHHIIGRQMDGKGNGSRETDVTICSTRRYKNKSNGSPTYYTIAQKLLFVFYLGIRNMYLEKTILCTKYVVFPPFVSSKRW
jgi:hypothetical protein